MPSKAEQNDEILKENSDAGNLRYFHKRFGKGHVIVSKIIPETIATHHEKKKEYLSLLRDCAVKYLGEELKEPEYLYIKRNRFVICHTFDIRKTINGRFIDIFSADLKVLGNVEMEKNKSVILYDIEDMLKSKKPGLLYSTYRLMGRKETKDETSFFIRGPKGIEGSARIFTAGKEVEKVDIVTPEGRIINPDVSFGKDMTMLISFPNEAEGLGCRIRWKNR